MGVNVSVVSGMFHQWRGFYSIDVIHKFVRDLYSKRFPELESLVHTPLEYVRTVQVDGIQVL